ncbi:hypothetical protein B0H16DRAFT_1453440 [Mycena metata]|uniref:Uncharacterized protein n=1 Tax=Mycena metata TaxID=1033252 RepID=A0AAD7NMQ1_9AGAR|nr:hypothetical protein B0H16DRAFT_1453440 [Mycena metata]
MISVVKSPPPSARPPADSRGRLYRTIERGGLRCTGAAAAVSLLLVARVRINRTRSPRRLSLTPPVDDYVLRYPRDVQCARYTDSSFATRPPSAVACATARLQAHRKTRPATGDELDLVQDGRERWESGDGGRSVPAGKECGSYTSPSLPALATPPSGERARTRSMCGLPLPPLHRSIAVTCYLLLRVGAPHDRALREWVNDDEAWGAAVFSLRLYGGPVRDKIEGQGRRSPRGSCSPAAHQPTPAPTCVGVAVSSSRLSLRRWWAR